jgi:tyrosine-protein phosphatase YwqE
MFTVGQLKELLKKYDNNTKVLCIDSEADISLLNTITTLEKMENCNIYTSKKDDSIVEIYPGKGTIINDKYNLAIANTDLLLLHTSRYLTIEHKSQE